MTGERPRLAPRTQPATGMTPDLAAEIIDEAPLQAGVIAGLAVEYRNCHLNAEDYAHVYGLHKPHGVTWTQWGEEQCVVLADDMAVRIDRLITLVEPGRSS